MIEGGRKTEILREGKPAGVVLPGDGGGIVGRTVIHDDDFQRGMGLRAKAREAEAKVMGAVPIGDDDGDERRSHFSAMRARAGERGSNWRQFRTSAIPVNDAGAGPVAEGGEIELRPFDFAPDLKHVPVADVVEQNQRVGGKADGGKIG